MRTRVTEQGVIIPKEWLTGIVEVDIRQENNHIIITPVVTLEQDPLLALGQDPINLDITDASINHDAYLTNES